MKIDAQFITKLLPNENRDYSWLRVVMDKWVKLYPGTIEDILEMTDGKKFWHIFLSRLLPSLLFLSFGASVILLLETYWIIPVTVLFAILIHFALYQRFSLVLPVKKYIRTQQLQELLDEIAGIISSRHAEEGLLMEELYRNISFEDLKKDCEEKATALAGRVLRGESIVAIHFDDDIVAEETNKVRRELSRLHRILAAVELLDTNLGKYYGREIPRNEPVGMEKV